MNLNWARAELVARRVVIVVLAVFGVVYAGDYLYARSRLAGSAANGILGSITVQRYWEIPQKSGKVEYSFDAPSQQTCIHSIFAHAGYSPCWYLSRRKTVRMSMLHGDHESLQAAARIEDVSAEAGRVPKV
jgi:hypothetical protein